MSYNTKKAIVEGIGRAVHSSAISFMQLFDPQFKNKFEIIFYPYSISVSGVLSAGADTLITKYHIQTLTIPTIKFEYDSANEKKYIKNVLFPEEVSMTFIENEEGVVRNWLDSWEKDIASLKSDTMASMLPGSNDKSQYVFKDNQNASKKNALITLKTGGGLPSPGGIVLMEGLKFKGVNDYTIGQNESDPLLIECTFAVDLVRMKTIAGSLF